MADNEYNKVTPVGYESLKSPELRILVQVTQDNTAQLVQINENLARMRDDMQRMQEYFSRADGGFRDTLDAQMKQHLSWLWLKMTASASTIATFLVGLIELIKRV